MLFFNKKTILKDLIPDDHIDFHSHLLFGIDDGAKTFDDTAGLVQSLMKFGIKQFITTPHVMQHVWENTTEIIINRQNEVNELLKLQQIDVTIKAAAEYLMDDHFAKLFKSQPLLTLKDNYVLVEMSYINAPIQLYEILFDLQVAGYKPVLAHPERYNFYHNNFDEYKKLKKQGCLFQLNLLSVMGYYGEGVAKTAQKLLTQGMIDFASSDTHHQKHIAAFDGKVLLKDMKPLQEAISNSAFFKQK
ncbi:tyrosine-protein phosphatase [Flavobacterium antarcticum]|uniref:tyrosine-protein phosphatase n=1 Tax=Flavobacterium antarcticum TaxID=271155 RepID=UPI0003B56FB7|nr:CpsB/CapC family capsule biosynthesis tyrosine phosphatase [Flavobacterium antarcticum]